MQNQNWNLISNSYFYDSYQSANKTFWVLRYSRMHFITRCVWTYRKQVTQNMWRDVNIIYNAQLSRDKNNNNINDNNNKSRRCQQFHEILWIALSHFWECSAHWAWAFIKEKLALSLLTFVFGADMPQRNFRIDIGSRLVIFIILSSPILPNILKRFIYYKHQSITKDELHKYEPCMHVFPRAVHNRWNGKGTQPSTPAFQPIANKMERQSSRIKQWWLKRHIS